MTKPSDREARLAKVLAQLIAENARAGEPIAQAFAADTVELLQSMAAEVERLEEALRTAETDAARAWHLLWKHLDHEPTCSAYPPDSPEPCTCSNGPILEEAAKRG